MTAERQQITKDPYSFRELQATGCPRASDPYCKKVVENPEVVTLADLAPAVCGGCPLEGDPNCHLPEPIPLEEAGYRR